MAVEEGERTATKNQLRGHKEVGWKRDSRESLSGALNHLCKRDGIDEAIGDGSIESLMQMHVQGCTWMLMTQGSRRSWVGYCVGFWLFQSAT